MLSTKNLVNDYTSVPAKFIFEYYCNLQEKLTGQEVTIKSIFNDQDNNPSMSIYIDKKTRDYKFKDFSTGIGGSAINLVMASKGLNFNQAALLIVSDYNTYKLLHPEEETKQIVVQDKFTVSDYKIRKWNTNDQSFWTDFYIGSEFLNEYEVKPLSEYTMSRVGDSFTMKGQFMYGYFTKDGELYKIYQPKNKERKFIKVKSHIQGSEQLKGYDVLIIQSSIKDIGAMKSLKLKVDSIAADSENVMILPAVIAKYKKEYKWVFVMFDNDEAGIKAMKKYREVYNLPCILLTIGKDLAEAVKERGPREIRPRVISLIELKTFDM